VSLVRPIRLFIISTVAVMLCLLAFPTVIHATGLFSPAAGSATTPKLSRTASAASAPAATYLSLTATPTGVWLRTSSTFSGQLTADDTAIIPTSSTVPLANEPVQIQVSTSTGVWQTVATATTDANGAFTVPVAINAASATYRASFAGDANDVASVSPNIQVTGFVADTQISITGPTKLYAESLVTYSAHFSVNDPRMTTHPGVPGASVDVYKKDYYGTKWVLVTRVVTNSSGNIAWQASVSTPTAWKLTAHSTARSQAAFSVIFRPTVLPSGKVFKLPASAPKPKPTAPQPAAIGAGAHPSVTGIPTAKWNLMTGISWHAGCPVGRSSLAYMTINYWGFDGYRHRGELVFRSSHKSEYVAAFTRLYNDHIPLHSMYLVDRFGYSSRTHGGDDYDSMEHDNTSAFNCRWVDGKPGTLSPHSYGTAVDINPYENPYHSAKGWTPNYWWRTHNFPPYTWRSRSSPAVQDMLQSGFHWTYGNEDSQHFDT
jgi:5-hydroxyisourate hydrolase-like protein (transthyretin family)